MHPADIKAALTKAGSSQSELARSLRKPSGGNVTPGAVWLVISGGMKSARIARRISEVTGLKVAVLWPGKYPVLETEQAAPARQPRRSSRLTHAARQAA